jgi:hypothetical protein
MMVFTTPKATTGFLRGCCELRVKGHVWEHTHVASERQKFGRGREFDEWAAPDKR